MNASLTLQLGIYGLGCVVAALTAPQNGPLMAMLVSLVMTAMVGCAPRLKMVMDWNLEWFWYMWPGVSLILRSLSQAVLLTLICRSGILRLCSPGILARCHISITRRLLQISRATR